jgi:hypothetical protein
VSERDKPIYETLFDALWTHFNQLFFWNKEGNNMQLETNDQASIYGGNCVFCWPSQRQNNLKLRNIMVEEVAK